MKLEDYALKTVDREIADEITYDDYSELQNGVSKCTDMLGNLVIVVSLDHEAHSILKKEFILEQVSKAIDEWGWLK
jgi:hypothetical protein